MRNVTNHVGKLEILERLPSSKNGNPRYRVSVDGFSCVTDVDCVLGYKVPNFDGKKVEATIGNRYGRATLRSVKPA